MRILAIRTSALGDAVLVTPVLRALHERHPGAELHFVTQPAWAPLFDGLPFVDQVWRWTMGGGRRTLRGIPAFAASLRRTGTFDLAVDLQNTPMVRLLLAAIRPRRTIHFVKRRTVGAVVSSIFGEGPVLDDLPAAALYLEALGPLGFPTHAAAKRGLVALGNGAAIAGRPRLAHGVPAGEVRSLDPAPSAASSEPRPVDPALLAASSVPRPGDPALLAASSVPRPGDPALLAASSLPLPDDPTLLAASSLPLPDDPTLPAASSLPLPGGPALLAASSVPLPGDPALPAILDPVTGWNLRPAVHLAPAAVAQAESLLRDAGGAPVAALAPGGRWAPKRWAPERFAQVGDALAREGARIVLVGGPGDTAELKAVAAAMRDPPLADTGSLDVAGLAAVIARADVLVGCDSAPNHIAQAVGTPSVIVFGPTSARRWGPLPGAGTSVSLPIGCAPCSNFGKRPCHLGHHACMQDLGPEPVIAAALAALRGGRMAGGAAAGAEWGRERVGLAMQVARSRREVRRR